VIVSIVIRCLNSRCGAVLPGQPMQMNSLEIRELRPPQAGDIAICAACGRIMIFIGVGYSVRNPSKTEAKLIGANEEVMRIRESIVQRLVKPVE
jgi:hypothetical protein